MSSPARLIPAALLLAAAAALFLWDALVATFTLGALIAGGVSVWLLMSGKGGGREPSEPPAGLGPAAGAARRAAKTPDPAAAGTLLEVTLNSMREGLVIVDRGMRVLAANHAAAELFGSVESKVVSRRLSELTRNPSIHAAFAAAVERGERAGARVETRDADPRYFDIHVAPLRERPGGEVRGAVGIFFDITRLERLERVRQEFLSNVSHELRTPLTAILTFVETLEGGAINDPTNNERFLSVIRRNAERMHSLIDDILELSAIEAGTVSFEKAGVRLRPLVAEVMTSVAARAGARRLTLLNEVDPEAVVYADPRRLEQMLTNLVDNAVKFNREGGTVTVRHESRGRDRISVSDTGEGIPPEHVKRIFERFYRIDRARSRAMGGTGLGLAIVKHLARAHGGEVAVRSAHGEGSTFVIELPPAQREGGGRAETGPASEAV